MKVRFGWRRFVAAAAATTLAVGGSVAAQEVVSGSDLLAATVEVEGTAQEGDENADGEQEAEEGRLRGEIEKLRAELDRREAVLRGMMLRRQAERVELQRDLAERMAQEARLAERVQGMLLRGQGQAQAGRYWLGIQTMPLEQLDEEQRKELKVDEGENGLVVEAVVEDSPAAGAGVEELDIIVAVDGNEVGDVGQLVDVVAKSEGKELTLDVVRKGDEITISVVPAERPQAFAIPQIGQLDLDLEQFQEGMPEIFLNGRDLLELRAGALGERGADLPAGLSVQVQRTGNEPAQIKVTYEGKTYEVTSETLDELPEEIRDKVKVSISGFDGNGFRALRIENAQGGEPLMLLRDIDVPGFRFDMPAFRFEGEAEASGDQAPAPAEADDSTKAELDRMRAEMAEIKAMLKQLLENRD